MRLGLRLNLYRSAELAVPVDRVRQAEELGFHSVWTAEAYGTDALTPLSYLAALTTRIKLATGVVQLAARPPASLAMAAMTIDALAGGGRVIIGLGVSGPQIVEGWYGQPWGHPTERLRDYMAIVRKVMSRDAPVSHDGPELSLPYRGPGSLGQGKALRSILHPAAPIPIWLAAGGPRNTALAAEVADGWLPMGLGPGGAEPAKGSGAATGAAADLAAGFARREGGRPADFEIWTGATVRLTDDVRGAIEAMRPLTAMYVGGMGSASHNFHRDAMARRGFPEAAARIQELWLAGRKQEAMAAVPDEYLEQGSLLGTPDRIRRLWEDGAATPPGVNGVIIDADQPEALELAAELAGTRDTAPAGGTQP